MAMKDITSFATALQGKVKTSMETPVATVAPVKDKKAKAEKKAVPFALRIKGELYEELAACAEREETSLNKLINKAIAVYLGK